MLPPTVLIATSNFHKVAEFQAIFAHTGLTVRTAADCGVLLPEIEEDGETPEANARIKAERTARETRHFCLADDTILVVDALHGQPGLRTARYAGPDATREENCRKLLTELAGVSGKDRTARFICCLHLAAPDGSSQWVARGECRGRILSKPAGIYGFGYDTHFWVDETQCTMAELDDSQRRRVTHRARACQRLLAEPQLRSTK